MVVQGKVKFMDHKKHFGVIKLNPEYKAVYINDEAHFIFKNIIPGNRLKRQDLVEFTIEQNGDKLSAKNIRLSSDIGLSFAQQPVSASIPRPLVQPKTNGNNAQRLRGRSESVPRAPGLQTPSMNIADECEAVPQSARSAENKPTTSGKNPLSDRKNPTARNSRKISKIRKDYLVGRIVNIFPKHGVVKPTDDLPDGYEKGSLVRFIPGSVKSGLLPIEVGDYLYFNLGIKDKAHPMALGTQLFRGKARDNQTINNHIIKLKQILSDTNKSQICKDDDDEEQIKECLLDVLTCHGMWNTIGNSSGLSNDTISLIVDIVQEVDRKSTSMRRSFAGILEALMNTNLFNPNMGDFRKFVDSLMKTNNKEKLEKVRKFLLLVLQNVPERTHTVLSFIKLMLPKDKDGLEHFMFVAMREIAKQNYSDTEDLEWNDMTLVPTSAELTGHNEEVFSNLRPVIEKGKYDSVEEYLDVYFRLLRADCFGSMCKHVQDLAKGKLDYRDMNVYFPVKLEGITVNHMDNGITVVLKVTSCVPVDNWEKTSKLMYGNLLCISPSGTFKDVIYAIVTNRDIHMLRKQLISVEFCSSSNQDSDAEALIRMSAAGEKMVVVESPTYYNAFKPVLSSLQSLTPDELPFKEELIEGILSRNSKLPKYIQQYINDIYVMFSSQTEVSEYYYKKLSVTWPKTLDSYQEDALWEIFGKRLAFVQGPPGTGKSFIGVAAVRTILNFPTKPDGPILVLTYKNHALDEFLKDLLQYYPDDIVRIGGRSQEDILKKCNINEIKGLKRKAKSLHLTIVDKRNEIEQNIPIILKSITRLQQSIKYSEQTVLSFLTKEQILNLVKGAPNKNTLPTGYDTDKFLKDLQEHKGAVSDFLNIDRQKIFKFSLEQWQPNWLYAERIVPKNILDFKTSMDARFARNIAQQPEVKKDDNNDDGLDEDDVREMLEERFAASIGIRRNGMKEIVYKLVNPGNNSILSKCIDAFEEPDDEALESVENVWDLQADQRLRLMQLLLWRQIAKPIENFQAHIQYHEQLCREKRELENQHKINIMMEAKVIGMTVTGASLNADLIRAVKPAIILIEEAAEVLEPQIIATLGSWVQHLIMIGDHKQLKPPVENYELVKHFKLDLSMMERLINNGLPYKALAVQNRMRPEFAALLKDIYPELKDGARVHRNKPVNCISKSMYFWDHQDPEEHVRSFTNVGEAGRVLKLAMFLVQQGYHPSKITILAAYLGQTTLLKKIFDEAVEKWKNMLEKYIKEIEEKNENGEIKRRERLFKIHTIDMYQGDENDIVIISTVRSNEGRRVGFLKEFNRRCVAQSRAKCGMYFCGNSHTLSSNPKWLAMINKMKEAGCLGPSVPLHCPKHPDSKIQAETANDITLSSFCKVICDTMMPCGKHYCEKPCQPPHGHSLCLVIVPFTHTRCKHLGRRKCYEDADKVPCLKPCSLMMGCKLHPCDKECTPVHLHHYCVEKVTFHCSKCGNVNEKQCSAEESSIRCEHEVQVKVVACGHINTKRCYEKLEKCKAKCPRILPGCGHPCNLKCGDVCNPAACKTCERIKKIEKEKQEKVMQLEREKLMAEISAELEKIKKSNSSSQAPTLVKLNKDDPNDVLEYNKVRDLVEKFIVPEHRVKLEVRKISKLTNLKLREAYLKCRKSLKDPTVSELKFHGTSVDAAGGICVGGFRLPASPGMFGCGIYFATDSSKSDLYSNRTHSNILLLCEVALGKVFVADQAMRGMNLVALMGMGFDSLYAKRDTKATGGVLNDEFVIYRPEQALPKYVIEYSRV